jgi:hypothetical protein
MDNPTTSSWHWSRHANDDTKYPVALVNATGTRYATNPTTQDAELLVQFYRGTLIGFAMMIANGHQPTGTIFKRFAKLMAQDATQLHFAFQTGWEGDDIYSEMVVIFLTLASEYQPPQNGTRGSFVGFINDRLPYRIANFVVQQQQDATNYSQDAE